MTGKIVRGILAASAALVIISGSVVAQETADQEAAAIETNASHIFNTVMSPFCPGRLIANCPSPSAAELREKIRGQLAQGATIEEITSDLYATYGDEIRSVPEAKGFGLLAWTAPGAFFVIVGVFLVLWIRSTARKGAPPAGTDTKELDAESAALLEEEMAKVR
jgi:cytochrome c-type biogenesis protein CcmH